MPLHSPNNGACASVSTENVFERNFHCHSNPYRIRITTCRLAFLGVMEPIKKDFEEFFNFCKNENFTTAEMLDICRPLIWQGRKRMVKRWAAVGLFAFVVYLLCNWVDEFSWIVSATGRLLLIQLLPYWSWPTVYNAKCVIERTEENMRSYTRSVARLSKFETDSGNCVLCETLELIPIASNVTFSFLESTYLERGLPVIITDSHGPKTLDDLLSTMHTAAFDFIESEPCDVATNLMLRNLFNLKLALQKIRTSHSKSKWFLQLRNCQFKAVKASRLFVTRPFYYPLHLEPFYSSWILMSYNYSVREREIYLEGLVFVQQLSGNFHITLRPKQPCGSACPVVNIRLSAGESLVFSTDLWIFSYGAEAAADKSSSVATILEIDWLL